MIAILATGALTTVQDQGRAGALRWGVGTAGAMDRPALAAGNLLVGNDEDAAGIEVQIFPFEARLEREAIVAVTGADCGATLDGEPLPPWTSAQAPEGAVLRLDVPGPARWRGSRAYVCVSGGIDTIPALGSRSTQLRGEIGGHEGRALRVGDRLSIGVAAENPPPLATGLMPPALVMSLAVDGAPAVRALPAAEYDRYRPASLDAFWSQTWKVTPQSDRYGFRLSGPALEPLAPMELRSHGIAPGVIQVPHGGQPIVQMCDAQPSGGYPKIATVIEADLWRLGQAPIGSQIRFIKTDWDGALAAHDEMQAWLRSVRTGLALLRLRSARS